MAILDAAADLLTTGGYQRLTMEGIAREAGVGKQTIYRWWDSKAALIAECLLEGRILPGQLGIPQNADLRTDLIAWLDTLFDFLKQPSGGVFRSIIAVAAQSPDDARRRGRSG